ASAVTLPGMLQGKVLPRATLNATLVSVKLKDAEAMPGVTVVRDVQFIGVAAGTVHLAEQALAAIQPEWKSPPQISDTDLFETLKKERGGTQGFGGRSSPSQGSIDQGLAAADHKLQATYTVAYIAHTPLEPRAAVAEWKD